MSRRVLFVFTGLCGLMMFTLCTVPAGSQSSEVKEKPPMFTYVAEWQIPRAHWADFEKSGSAVNAIMDKAQADGIIVGHGRDENLVHQTKGSTHDNWWAATSMAGIVKVLDQLRSSGNSSSEALNSATGHWDSIFMSRYYNWHSGPYTGAYTRIAGYKLKDTAPDNALEMLSKNLFVPLMEKMLADGTILEYEVDTMAVHTEDPGTFWIVFTAAKPEGMDTVQEAILASIKAQPLSAPAFDSVVTDKGHRDMMLKGDGVYK